MGEVKLPGKNKKKKRSFFEDDDFFVLKKNKSSKQKGPSMPVKPVSSESLKAESSNSVKAVSSDSVKTDDDVIGSDDLLQSFHSARDAFSGDETDTKSEVHAIEQEIQVLDVLEDNNMEETSIVEVDPVDNEDDPDTALSRFFKGISGSVVENPSEEARIYTVHMRSEVYDINYEVESPGDTTFQEVLLQALLLHGLYHHPQHDEMMMWVEGKSELKSFFKPSTLRIPPAPYGTPTKVTVLHMYRGQLPKIDSLYSRFEDNKENNMDLVILVDDEKDIIQLESPPKEPPLKQFPLKETCGSYFVIGLKGKDNKRIECEVGADTRIRDLLDYYLKVKGITVVKNPKLVFDDEILDLDGKVGDTELEEDFEVEVYV